MRRVRLNGLYMRTRDKAHRHIRRRLRLPEYYGGNLDALSDCLGELGDTQITLTHARAMRRGLGDAYAARLLSVLAAATGENPRVKLSVREGL